MRCLRIIGREKEREKILEFYRDFKIFFSSLEHRRASEDDKIWITEHLHWAATFFFWRVKRGRKLSRALSLSLSPVVEKSFFTFVFFLFSLLATYEQEGMKAEPASTHFCIKFNGKQSFWPVGGNVLTFQRSLAILALKLCFARSTKCDQKFRQISAFRREFRLSLDSCEH